jgi:curved DNA-binding protein CbpA
MPLAEALALFRRLGVCVEGMSWADFALAYFALAKRYHPDRNPNAAELMANINVARATIVNSYRSKTSSAVPRRHRALSLSAEGGCR